MRIIPTLKDGRQNPAAYTREDMQVWKILFERQYPQLEKYASEGFIEGLRTIGFSSEQIPDFDKVNSVLMELTGWQLVAVPGIVGDREFFAQMADRKFPATTWLRSLKEIDYLEEPDMFHDVFAHVPLLTNPHFAEFLVEMSKISLEYIDDPYAIELLSRVYWYTVEFGLIRERGNLRIYGAGILSSVGETQHSMGTVPMKFDFNAEHLLHSPYRKDIFQDRYFIIDSYEQLYKCIDELPEILRQKLDKTVLFS